MTVIILLSTAVVVLALAVACGGGLDEDTTPASTPPPPVARQVRPRPLMTTAEMTALDERSYPELPVATLRQWLYPIRPEMMA